MVKAGLHLMQVSISSKIIPPGTKLLGHNLKGAKTLGTIIAYKTPPLGTEQGVKSPIPGT